MMNFGNDMIFRLVTSLTYFYGRKGYSKSEVPPSAPWRTNLPLNLSF